MLLKATSFSRLEQAILDSISGKSDASTLAIISASNMNPLARMIIKKTDIAAVDGMQALAELPHLFQPDSSILACVHSFKQGTYLFLSVGSSLLSAAIEFVTAIAML